MFFDTVDSIMASFIRKAEQLEQLAEIQATKADNKRIEAAEATQAADEHTAEANRATNIAANIKKLFN